MERRQRARAPHVVLNPKQRIPKPHRRERPQQQRRAHGPDKHALARVRATQERRGTPSDGQQLPRSLAEEQRRDARLAHRPQRYTRRERAHAGGREPVPYEATEVYHQHGAGEGEPYR